MAAKLRHLYQIIVGAILSFLGITGAGKADTYVQSRENFGKPQASFKIMGEVLSEDGTPLQGVRVRYSRLEYTDESGHKQYFESEENEFLTDKDGKVEASAYDYTTEPQEVTIALDGGRLSPRILRGKDLDISFTRENGTQRFGNYTIAFTATMKQA